jgi:hypothetical protein
MHKMQLNELWLIIWSWDLALMGALTGQVLSQKKYEGFCGSKKDDLFGLVCFFFFEQNLVVMYQGFSLLKTYL